MIGLVVKLVTQIVQNVNLWVAQMANQLVKLILVTLVTLDDVVGLLLMLLLLTIKSTLWIILVQHGLRATLDKVHR